VLFLSIRFWIVMSMIGVMMLAVFPIFLLIGLFLLVPFILAM
jgi:hypothetical protein